jgi:RNA polymerase sigma-70 factor (ECF subfamily)
MHLSENFLPRVASETRSESERLVSGPGLSSGPIGRMPMPQEEIDREMLAQVARGDQRAFGQLYDRLSNPLFSLALRMLGDSNEAQDALQDVFLQIWRRASVYDAEQGSVFSWAVLMTRSRAIDRLRARGRRLRVIVSSTDDTLADLPPPAASDRESAADSFDRNEAAMRVRSSLSKLPTEQREAIELAFFNDLTHHEIADQLGQPLGTIKARIRRGLLKLRERTV